MEPLSPLGCVYLDAPTTYRGVQRPSEKLIDALYASADLNALLQAIHAHVAQRYRNDFGPNEHLASIVTDEVNRSLASYAGPAPLTSYNPQRLRLSHWVNLKAKTRHRDELRNLRAKKRTVVVLAQDHASRYKDGSGVERQDVLSFLSDELQYRKHRLPEQERALALGPSGYPWGLRAGTLRVSTIPARAGWHYEQIVDTQK
jgi:hypothetical protein